MSTRPEYTDPSERFGSGSLPQVPPFGMRNVSCRAFPLASDMNTLNQFCAQYLNMDVPPTIAHFRPALPFVYLLVLDYGAMSPSSIGAQNLGWVAQHEVLFMVPLQRWRKERGKFVFKDWACVSPFIFVDNAMSQRTGREVYGWPKVLGHIKSDTPRWVSDLNSPTRQFSMSVNVMPKTYAGQMEEPRHLLHVDYQPPSKLLQLPLDPTNPFGILSTLNTAGSSALELTNMSLDMLLGIRARGFQTNRTAGNLRQMLDVLGPKLSSFLPWLPNRLAGGAEGNSSPLAIEQITLKQFRDVANPIAACYQALVRSPMAVDNLNAFGFLGDSQLLRGDTSGGYRIRLHNYDSQPIVSSLGLKVFQSEEDVDGSRIDVLKPIVPFWTNVDLAYGAGSVICSRIPSKGPDAPIVWRDEQEDKIKPEVKPEPSTLDHIPYNTARGAATQPVSGPFFFPDLTLQAFPLLADKKKLQDCVDKYLNDIMAERTDANGNVIQEKTGFEFEVLGSYAYLMVVRCDDEIGTMWSGANDIGWWAERDVSFSIPVKWKKNGEFQTMAMVSPFVFANSGRAVLTDREVNGRPAVQAEINSPEDVWFARPSGPDSSRKLLEVTSEVFPALNLGQKSEQLPILEIDQCDVLPHDDQIGWRVVAEKWGEDIVTELGRLTNIYDDCEKELVQAKALIADILSNAQPINWISLKQYRDTKDPDKACYQSVVHNCWHIRDVYDVREILDQTHVHLHRYPGQPIAETLGLKIKKTHSSEGSVIDRLQPMRPFWARMSMHEDLGRELCWRANDDSKWTVAEKVFSTPGSNGEYDGIPKYASSGFFKRKGFTPAVEDTGNNHLPRIPRDVDVTRRKVLENDLAILERNLGSLEVDTQILEETRIESDTDLFSDTSDINPYECLARLRALGHKKFSQELAIRDLYAQVEAMIRVRPAPGLGARRVSFDEALKAVEKIDELQVIIGSVLTAKWHHRGDTESETTPPEVGIREDSIGSWHERDKWKRHHKLDGEEQGACPGWLQRDNS